MDFARDKLREEQVADAGEARRLLDVRHHTGVERANGAREGVQYLGGRDQSQVSAEDSFADLGKVEPPAMFLM